jgi:hypothetical protein
MLVWIFESNVESPSCSAQYQVVLQKLMVFLNFLKKIFVSGARGPEAFA